MNRILRGVPGTMRLTVTDANGSLVDPDGNAVTLGVVRQSDGSAVTAPGTAAVRESQGVYRHSPTTALLDVYEATWSFEVSGVESTATTYAEVVGGRLFTNPELRAFHSNLASESKYPDPRIEEAREQVEDEFEEALDRSLFPRYRKQRLSGRGLSTLLLDKPDVRSVRSVRVYSDADSYTSFDADDLSDLRPDAVTGELQRVSRGVFAIGSGNLEVVYEYGLDSPPVGLKRLAMQRARFLLNERFAATDEGVVDDEGAALRRTLGSYRGVRKALDESEWSMRVPGVA